MGDEDRNERPGTEASRWVVAVLQRTSLNRVNFTVPGGLHVNGPMFREVAQAVQRGTIAVSSGGGDSGTQRGVANGEIATYNSEHDILSIPSERNQNVAYVVCHEAVHAYCDMHSLQINRLTEEAAGYLATAAANYHYQRVVAERDERTAAFERQWRTRPALMHSPRTDVEAVYMEAAQLARREGIYRNRADNHDQHDLSDVDLHRLRQLISEVSWYRGIGEDERSTQHNGLTWRSERCGERFCLRRR